VVRRFSGRPPLKIDQLKSEVNIHNFFDYYIELPCADFFLQEWQKFLQIQAIQLHHLLQTTEEIIKSLLFLSDFESLYFNPGPQKIATQLTETERKFQSMKILKNNLNHHEKESIETQQNNTNIINRDILYEWELLGAGVSPGAHRPEKNQYPLEKT